MKHPNTLILEKIYADFSKGDFNSFLGACSEKITFQVPGKSKLAGKYTRADFVPKFVTLLQELSGGTFQFEAHDILASDQHGIVLGMERLNRAGKPIEMRTVHVWRFEGGKPVAWYEYPRDLYVFDATWA
jgi:ketosteroid isomerase-like protein